MAISQRVIDVSVNNSNGCNVKTALPNHLTIWQSGLHIATIWSVLPINLILSCMQALVYQMAVIPLLGLEFAS
jgi:hypothetical protein